VTRQAVTKHLRVLEDAGLARSTRQGRCTLFTFTPGPIVGLRDFLDQVARHWDERLGRLKALVEAPDRGT
jgi:DNA-binding transcriptional ArsR family regulator